MDEAGQRRESRLANLKAHDRPQRNGYKLWYSGEDERRNGVGIVLASHLIDSVTDVVRKGDRMIALRIKFFGRPLYVVSAYAPQTAGPDDEKELFWDTLTDLCRLVRPEETLVLGGDLSGHIGEKTPAGYKRVHGGRGFGTMKSDGERILQLATDIDLAIVNRYYTSRRDLLTWSPTETTRAKLASGWSPAQASAQPVTAKLSRVTV